MPSKVPLAVDLTLSGPEVTWTLSFNENLVETVEALQVNVPELEFPIPAEL